MNRRALLSSAPALILAASPASAFLRKKKPTIGNEYYELEEHFKPQMVEVPQSWQVGSIRVISDYFMLYHVRARGQAWRVGVSLGEDGMKFRGRATITRKALKPRWSPTPNMLRRRPDLYGPYRNGLPGGHPKNPMGSAALYMSVNGRPTYYRIHGTNIPWSIGLAYETGCIKLRNDHMEMLYPHVAVGTRMLVT
ncbi:L,D-transpeptidase [Nereida sp. MMG025]|uniref:L,D-transpeptidase n=1 Tax=Nereida sp. MMG025 TaxID=2909981 RepID=UPI001F26276C|nr:L,D-transpeptidase [Nereida sp. MMG025]MCF6444826.1 L,D-transpeptidase [Nereida sp. MMG025]